MEKQKKPMSIEEFKKWIASIEFVDESGRVIPVELPEDTSEDPEGDRG